MKSFKTVPAIAGGVVLLTTMGLCAHPLATQPRSLMRVSAPLSPAAVQSQTAQFKARSQASTGPYDMGWTQPLGVLKDRAGMTVYTFDRDIPDSGKSTCSGRCAKLWKPVKVVGNAQGDADYSVITRIDGTRQWAFDGKPIYRYAKDIKPGDARGNSVNKHWHVVVVPAGTNPSADRLTDGV
jgi:predicted lipoprotein with Yx(FWY)xxD motif